MKRFSMISAVAVMVIAVTALTVTAANSVRVYVPQQGSLNAQELMVGIPGDIYVEIINDTTMMGIELPLEFSSSGSGDLWPQITAEHFTFLPDADVFGSKGLNTVCQDGNWPDTLLFYMVIGGLLTPGERTVLKMTVTPTAAGVVEWTAPTYVEHMTRMLRFFGVGGADGELIPEFIAPEITILGADCNNNGFPDEQDISAGTSLDCNGNGIPDECEIDCNANGFPDDCDISQGRSLDCNSNDLPDECDLETGVALDCNENGIPDVCDIGSGTSYDLDANGIPDECEGSVVDAVTVYVPAGNGHGPQELVAGTTDYIYISATNFTDIIAMELTLEYVDLGAGSLWPELDSTAMTFLPDADQFSNQLFRTSFQDGNWPDTLFTVLISTSTGVSPGTHDLMRLQVTPTSEGRVRFSAPTFVEGEFTRSMRFVTTSSTEILPFLIAEDITILPADCNDNGVPDTEDIGFGTSEDCNANSIPDECELADGTLHDLNLDGIPDACADCNENGVADGEDISSGTSQDCNTNGLPDECDIGVEGFSDDDNLNGIPDECESSLGNILRVYVPAGNGHLAQQMIVGQPEDVYVEINTLGDHLFFEIPLEVRSIGGVTLWPLPTGDEVEFVGDSQFFPTHLLNEVDLDGIWSDTMLFVAGGHLLDPGAYPVFKLTVVPTAEGVVQWSAPTYQSGEFIRALRFMTVTEEIIPALVAPEITIISAAASTLCCSGNPTGNVDCDPQEKVTLADIARLIDYVYITHQPLCCMGAANTNGDPTGNITLSDVSRLIDNIYISKLPTATCP